MPRHNDILRHRETSKAAYLLFALFLLLAILALGVMVVGNISPFEAGWRNGIQSII